MLAISGESKGLEFRGRTGGVKGGTTTRPGGRWCVTSPGDVVALLVRCRRCGSSRPADGCRCAPASVDTRLVVTEVKVCIRMTRRWRASRRAISRSPRTACTGEPVADLRNLEDGVYLIGYYSGPSKADGQFRKLNVAVKTVTVAKVEHRAGFTVVQNAGSPRASVKSDDHGEYPAIGCYGCGAGEVVIFRKEPEYTEEAWRKRNTTSCST